MTIHHIGYLVKNMDASIKKFCELGYTMINEPVIDTARDISICFMEKCDYVLELISPTKQASQYSPLLKKMGNSPYHICYEVENIELAIKGFLSQGYLLFQPPSSALALNNRKVCFLMHAEIGMIELLEVL